MYTHWYVVLTLYFAQSASHAHAAYYNIDGCCPTSDIHVGKGGFIANGPGSTFILDLLLSEDHHSI